MPNPRVTSSIASRSAVIWTAFVMAATPLVYWLTTGQVWEDCLITFRASHNWATGHGLTYQIGERVYSFTSPLNASVLAAFDWLTHSGGYATPLGLYNIVSIACYVTGGMILVRLLTANGSREALISGFFFPILLVLCGRTTAFVVNGQEAGFWVLFLAVSFGAVVRGAAENWLALGIGWCGLMWTRPDSPVQIAIQVFVIVGFSAKEVRSENLKGILRASLVCAAGYLPWFAGTWIYYGSPIPNSVQAKVGAYLNDYPPWTPIPIGVKIRDTLGGTFSPIYGYVDWMWGSAWLWTAALLGAVVALVWTLPGISRLTRMSSAAFCATLLYLGFLWARGLAFPWYFVPACVFGSLVCARLPFEWPSQSSATWKVIPFAFAAVVLCVTGRFFAMYVPYATRIQDSVEAGVRVPVGLWLRDHVKPGERVFLEPIGYIGYYSQAALYDYPGLTSPEVVRLRRKGLKFYDLIDALKPRWLVLRVNELAGLLQRADVAGNYAVVSHLCRAGDAGGGDAEFYILKRKDRLPQEAKQGQVP